jgi:hypothetical protein
VTRSPSRDRPRGQTTLDFAIGISLFLVVIVFVFSFVPGMLQPFVVTGAEHPVMADRLGDRLAQGQLGHPEEPFVLENDCAVEFFNDSRYNDGLGSPSDCRYDGNALHERAGVTNTSNLNVTLEGNTTAGVAGSTTLCWDRDPATPTLNQTGSGNCGGSDDVTLTTGGAPPTANDATVTARRVVSLAGEDVTMKVVVW